MHRCVYLVQLLLPLCDNDGQAFEPSLFQTIRSELTGRFGGVTSYQRAPAEGSFDSASGKLVHDDIVIFEVMCDALDRSFWSGYRAQLQSLFAQEELVVRAMPLQRL